MVNQFDGKLAILVNTCDAYSDVLSLFFAAFEEFASEIDINLYINAESLNYDYQLANVINNKNVSIAWGERLISSLEKINSEYVVVLYDDFILEGKLDLHGIIEALNLLDNDKFSSVVYLVNSNLPLSGKTYGRFSEINNGSDYIVNSFPGVWRRRDLINYTDLRDTPWSWEVFGSLRTYNGKNCFWTLGSDHDDIYPYNYSKGGAIYRGKWVREVVEQKFDKYDLNIDSSIRGYSIDDGCEKRSFFWKLNFIFLGFKLVGFKAFIFIFRSLIRRFRFGS